MVTSYRAAAQVTGLAPATVREWVETRELPGPPWTVGQLKAVRDRHATVSRRRGSSSPHGTALRYAAGCSCDECRRATREDVARREHLAADRRFPVEVRSQLIGLLTAGVLFGPAVRQLGLSPRLVWGRRSWDAAWAVELTTTLDAARPADLTHGHRRAYAAGCRCTDCRAAAHSPVGL